VRHLVHEKEVFATAMPSYISTLLLGRAVRSSTNIFKKNNDNLDTFSMDADVLFARNQSKGSNCHAIDDDRIQMRQEFHDVKNSGQFMDKAMGG
jgi:hypothetical protein